MARWIKAHCELCEAIVWAFDESKSPLLGSNNDDRVLCANCYYSTTQTDKRKGFRRI